MILSDKYNRLTQIKRKGKEFAIGGNFGEIWISFLLIKPLLKKQKKTLNWIT